MPPSARACRRLPGSACRRGKLRHAARLDVPAQPSAFARAVKAWLPSRRRAASSAGGRPRDRREIAAASGASRCRGPGDPLGQLLDRGPSLFSWRLMMAPSFVAEYVVAHEVAHLKAMHHGRSFWMLVEKLYGDPEPPAAGSTTMASRSGAMADVPSNGKRPGDCPGRFAISWAALFARDSSTDRPFLSTKPCFFASSTVFLGPVHAAGSVPPTIASISPPLPR